MHEMQSHRRYRRYLLKSCAPWSSGSLEAAFPHACRRARDLGGRHPPPPSNRVLIGLCRGRVCLLSVSPARLHALYACDLWSLGSSSSLQTVSATKIDALVWFVGLSYPLVLDHSEKALEFPARSPNGLVRILLQVLCEMLHKDFRERCYLHTFSP